MKNQLLMMSALALGGATVGMAGAHADVRLHPLFTDNMVLQRDKNDAVWGTADAGEHVTVSVAGQSATAVARLDGRWMVRLQPLKVATNLTMTVSGKNTLTLRNVAVGDVYLCSGQSNMEYPLQSWSPPDSAVFKAAQAEIAKANYPNIRLLTIPHAVKAKPQSEASAPINWNICTPQTAGGFSAVGYYFGRELNRRLGIPIGLIDSTWGGTIIEAWTSPNTMQTMPQYRPAIASLEESERATLSMPQRIANWWKNVPGSQDNAWAQPSFDDASWSNMTLPTNWENAGLPGFDGIVWFRKTIDVPGNLAGKEMALHLGAIDDSDTTWFNGTQIGAMEMKAGTNRIYTVPGNLVKAGRNVITVRVLDTGGDGGINGGINGETMRLDFGPNPLFTLSGAWKYHVAAALNTLPPFPTDFANNPNQPTVLYNGMIAPLVPLSMRGAIWYQGESNAGAAAQYRTLMPALIRDWRARFGQDFGFYYVQLANFMARGTQPEESGWAELREAQTMTLSLPRTGMATIIDIGDAGDIHPTNKRDVGVRLALNALAKEYGQNVEYSGPMFQSVKRKGNTLRLSFSHAAGLHTSDGRAPAGFAIAGSDRKFVWATARLQGQSVVLSNPAVLAPMFVRYAWANNPDTDLYNAAGLPAVPFRSDVPMK
jgi:sialate O-acetylesterase